MNAFLARWKEYFEVNAALPEDLPWDSREEASGVDIALIGPSMAAFHLGENSDGAHLMAAAAAYAERPGWNALPAITRLFIREEQNHARLLGRFMDRHGIPRLQSEWTDIVFRALRKHMGMEIFLPVLLTAEIIALVYYRALAASTPSALLRALCRKILADETAHVAYETALLEAMRKRQFPALADMGRALHAVLYAGTVLVVYFRHRPVLDRGGYPLVPFVEACWKEFGRAFAAGTLAAPAVPEPGSWEDEGSMEVTLRWEPVGPDTGEGVRGSDVSRHQGRVDWPKVKAG